MITCQNQYQCEEAIDNESLYVKDANDDPKLIEQKYYQVITSVVKDCA